jgi:hypothetical protein
MICIVPYEIEDGVYESRGVVGVGVTFVVVVEGYRFVFPG